MLKLAMAVIAAMTAVGGAEAASIVPIDRGNNSYDLSFRIDRPDAQFLSKFSYDLTIRMDFGAVDPFSSPAPLAGMVRSGMVAQGGFGGGDANYFNGLLSGYSTDAPVHWHLEGGYLYIGNRPIITDAGWPDIDVHHENAFGAILWMDVETNGNIWMDPQVVMFRDRLFNDHAAWVYTSEGVEYREVRVTDLNVPVVSPPVAAVPEPATWMMMIGGFGLIGCAMRRRVRIRYTLA